MRIAIVLVLALVAITAGVASPAGATHAASVVARQGRACISQPEAAATHHAALVVSFGDGRTLTYCIEFSAESITGKELLRRSGLTVVTASSDLGAAVCSIDGQGCNDPGDCFCQCKSGTCSYWSYFKYVDGAWAYSPAGAGLRQLHDGDADGWVWGNGKSPPGASGVVCPTSTPTPSPVPSPTQTLATATAVPSRTAPPRPSATPRPSSTAPLGSTETATVPAIEATAVAGTTPRATTQPPAPPTSGAIGPTAGPTTGVLGEEREPASAAASSATMKAESATPAASSTAGAGVIQISDAQGKRNLAGETAGGGWSWGSTLTFGVVGVVLLGAGGVVIWRRRAGV